MISGMGQRRPQSRRTHSSSSVFAKLQFERGGVLSLKLHPEAFLESVVCAPKMPVRNDIRHTLL